MAESLSSEIWIDPEFQKLIPPLTKEEYTQLECNIIADGCREPITLWRGFILDGHNRYAICQQHNIPFKTVEKKFDNRASAIVWICANQLGRRNIPEETRKYLIGKRYEAEKVVGVKNTKGVNQYSNNEVGPIFRDKPKSSESTHIVGVSRKTAERLGAEYHISHSTVEKYGRYAKAIDTLYEQDTTIAPKLLSGEVKMSHENTLALAESEHQVVQGFDKIASQQTSYLSYKDTRKQMSIQKKSVTGKKELAGTVKEMPHTDLDAEVTSLSYTIPSWSGTITRVFNMGVLDMASEAARMRLEKQLLKLQDTITIMLLAIKEKS